MEAHWAAIEAVTLWLALPEGVMECLPSAWWQRSSGLVLLTSSSISVSRASKMPLQS